MSDLHLLTDLYSVRYSKEDLGSLPCSYSWTSLHFQIQELPKGIAGKLLIEPLALVPGRALDVQMNHGMWVFLGLVCVCVFWCVFFKAIQSLESSRQT